MSYADKKHARKPICYAPNCNEDGTTLATVRGVLGWWCDRHKK